MLINQGASLIATPVKQAGLRGLVHLFVNRWKFTAPLVLIDLYAGSGVNYVGTELIDGSPLSVLDGLAMAIQQTTKPLQPCLVVFNDIVDERSLLALPANVRRWQELNDYPIDEAMLTIVNKLGQSVALPIVYKAHSALDVVERIRLALEYNPHRRFLLVIDPNGPTQAPWPEVIGLWQRYSKRLEIIWHISATALKRRAGAAIAKPEYNWKYAPDHIADLLEKFPAGGGWVRAPVGADQWTILLLTRFPPRDGWPGQNFIPIGSPDGQLTVKLLSTNKQDQ